MPLITYPCTNHFVSGLIYGVLVFDFKDLNIYDGTTDSADAEITISDEDFYLVGTKETTFDALLAEVCLQQ